MKRNSWLLQWIAITVFSSAVGLSFSFTQIWQAVEMRLFDQFTVLTAPEKSVLPIVIVGIDEPSFVEIGKRWPWPRDLHARLIERLTDDGAAVIAFDTLFSEKEGAKEDAKFAAAVRYAGNVVLAADHAYRETAMVRQWMRVDPLPEFLSAGATAGLASAVIDGDAVVRRFPDADDIFWRQVIATLQRMRPDVGAGADIPPGALIRHFGPAHTFPYVSYHQAIDRDAGLPPGFFQDQVVLIGRDVRATPGGETAQSDMFATPFLGRSQLLTPGVEIHATLIENALTGQAIAPTSQKWVIAAMVFFIVLATPALARWHPFGSGAWILALCLGALGLSYWLFSARAQWLPVLATLLTLLSMYFGSAMMSHLAERRRSAYIKNTFSKYVSPQVVEHMVSNPDSLKLGGEKRELTVLFCDLAGFTTMSEKLPPERVAQIINLYLTEMTRVVIAYGGTVDKFIGDAVMAFWGAPLDDPAHALHGVKAAIAMQEAMAKLKPQLADLGSGEMSLRIGLHSGPAIVGNMGSEERFDYTALGDTVNLASRLEGVNKAYGTNILLSEATAKSVSDGIIFRPVDRVRVKGKQHTVNIFTVCGDQIIVERTIAALSLYHSGRWSASLDVWKSIAKDYPDDPLAEVFVTRISEYDGQAPADWDGAISLEK